MSKQSTAAYRTGLATALLAALAAVAPGCADPGPETYPVRGRVTHQGKPVPTGNVMFVPDQGPAATSTIAQDGTFELRAVAGKHRVAITAFPSTPPDFDPLAGDEVYVPPGPARAAPVRPPDQLRAGVRGPGLGRERGGARSRMSLLISPSPLHTAAYAFGDCRGFAGLAGPHSADQGAWNSSTPTGGEIPDSVPVDF